MASESDRPQIVLLRQIWTDVIDALASRFQLLKPWESPLPRERFLAAYAAAARALLVTGLAPVDSALLDALPSVRFVITTSIGVDHIDLAECARRGITLANVGSLYTTDVAEYAVGILIDVLRRVTASDRYVRRGMWPIAGDYPLGFQLRGKRVGIVGLGSIGSAVAKRLEAFGCSISYFSRKKRPSVPYAYFSNARDLAAESDVLVVACALTNETHQIVNKDVLSALGKDGVLINVGRGPLVDEQELIKLLRQGEIGGAGLDVFEREPYVPVEFFSMDNIVISDHAAVHTSEVKSELAQLLIANLEAFFGNRPLLTPVSLSS